MEHDPKLTIPSSLWRELISELHRRTGERHESGAFLLGHSTERGRRVEQVVYYDDLDPLAYRTDAVVMHAASFGTLWDRCKLSGLSVVADIHVHPRAAFQSHADRKNPMIAVTGHLALIVPNFACPPVALKNLGFFEYRGSHRWRSLGGPQIRRFLQIDSQEDSHDRNRSHCYR